jgi:hypothetical protein
MITRTPKKKPTKAQLHAKEKEIKNAQCAIAQIHSDRLDRYLEVSKKSYDDAIFDLIAFHRSGKNMALHISSVIGDLHSTYVKKLTALGEVPMFIQ